MLDKDKTIFITIAACKEYYLIHTIKSAISAAKYPDRIYFGIFNTVVDKDSSLLNKLNEERYSILKSPNIFYTELHSPTPMGIGFSRMNAALMFDRNHDFVLQIDAHCIFDKNWDETIINNYNVAQEYSKEPVILSSMTYGFEYDLNDRENIYWKNKVKIDFENFNSDDTYDLGAMPSIRTNGINGNNKLTPSLVGIAWVDSGPWNDKKITFKNTEFHEGNCVFAAMMFYSFKDLIDILHYPKDMFSGDQINFSLRLISRGFRIFHFYKPVFVSLTKYDPQIDTEYQWKDSCKANPYNDYVNASAAIHHKQIFSGKYFGYWGAPDKEALIKAKKIMDLENYLSE